MPILTNEIILTAQPEAAAVAFTEIQRLDPAARLRRTLSAEARLVSLPGGYHALLEALRTQVLIFPRHIFPVHYTGQVTETPPAECLPLADDALAARPFSVQLRVEPRDDTLFARGLALTRATEEALTAQGFVRDDQSPGWVVSYFLRGASPDGDPPGEATLYAGLSHCDINRSSWNGGAARYKKDNGHISRAEFKLLEAFALFGYDPGPGLALDLGAAPGGWTRTLLDRGLTVTAVDPAALHECLRGHPRLHHVRETAQRFTSSAGSYDLIVNDMRMDAAASCRILLDGAAWLRPTGKMIMTVKLTPGQWYQKTKRALALLERQYRIINARQLFHNRDEVTVYAEKADRTV